MLYLCTRRMIKFKTKVAAYEQIATVARMVEESISAGASVFSLPLTMPSSAM